MSTPAPIVLNLYNPETNEVEKTFSRSFVPWKLLKRATRINRTIGKKQPEEMDESDIDELANLVIAIFDDGLTVEMLDEQSDLSEMMTVIRSIVMRARVLMDPTSPPKA